MALSSLRKDFIFPGVAQLNNYPIKYDCVTLLIIIFVVRYYVFLYNYVATMIVQN